MRTSRLCRNCAAAYMRKTRPAYKELTEQQRKRVIARAYANVYLRRGKIKRKRCRICGKKAHMHHPDYSKPLEIEWLCRKHHLELHRK